LFCKEFVERLLADACFLFLHHQATSRLRFQREFNVLLGRLLRLLDEAMQKDHVTVAHAENHARYPVAVEITPYLP
jgi:hypothetical protein